MVVTVVARSGHVPTDLASRMIVDADGPVAGTVGGGALENRAIEEAGRLLVDRRHRLREFLLDESPSQEDDAESCGMLCGGRVTLWFEYVGAADRALLFGAGHVNRALQAVLAPLGFDVLFLDSRPELLRDLPAPGRRVAEGYAELKDLPSLEGAHVVVATHGHALDEEVLVQLLAREQGPAYLGLVASRRKRERLFESLRRRCGEDVDLGRIHAPAGLELGGNSPAAVALSIAAEMQAARHGIAGHRHLRDHPAGERRSR